MGFIKWIRRTLHTDTRGRSSSKDTGVQRASNDTTKTPRKSKLTRTHRTSSLSRDNKHIIRVLPPVPSQPSSLQWLDLDTVSRVSVEHVYEEISDKRVFANITDKQKDSVENRVTSMNHRVIVNCIVHNEEGAFNTIDSLRKSSTSSRAYANVRQSLNVSIRDITSPVRNSESSLDSGYQAETFSETDPQKCYENIDNIVRGGMLNTETRLKSVAVKDEVQNESDSDSDSVFLGARPDPVGCNDSYLDFAGFNLTTVSSLSNNSGLDFNTPAAAPRPAMLRTPGWKWECDEGTFDVLPANNGDDDDDNISEGGSDSDDVMSMSMMTAAIKELEHKLKMKKLKKHMKSRRQSCPIAQTMSSCIF